MKKSKSKWSAALLMSAMALGLTVASCKGSTTYKDSPETIDRLDKCKQTVDQKQKLITDYEAEIARLQRGSAAVAEIVLTIEGDVLKVKAGSSTAAAPPLDDKAAQAASARFVDLVSRSRGAIQKCYEQALKKNTGIQGRTISLRVSASFNASGAFQSSNFSPTISDNFDSCMKTIASKWQLPAGPQAMSFQASVSLTPS
ncbi:MAG: hypothetical protein KBG15_12525 [Kofleriaceae bacterium]|nr:hypothetical protein [Kofleriaceae bacterium]